MTSPMIEVEQLRVRFGETEAVKGVSFVVPQGDSFGIVGESGSGKSTVLRALSGLNPDWTGRMSVDGMALGPTRDKRFFRRVQMVFQDPYGSLHPRQTVDRALSEPLLVHGIGDVESHILQGLAEVALSELRALPLSASAIRRAAPARRDRARADGRTRGAVAG